MHNSNVSLPHETHLVVSRYNESLEWLSELTNPRSVYDKSGDQPPQGVPLPNVGREAHTFAHYLAEHYDNLPNRVCFLQGDPRPHLRMQLTDLLADPAPLVFGNHPMTNDGWGNPAHPGLPVQILYLEFFNDPRTAFTFSPGAQYIVSRDRVRFRPRRFYEVLANMLSYAAGPWEAWAVERFWSVIFDGATPDYFQTPREIPQLAWYLGNEAIGPIQRDEATFLFSLTRVVRPRVAIEFGTGLGYSLRCFLEAVPDLILYTYDVHRHGDLDRHLRKYGSALRFIQKSHSDFSVADLDLEHRQSIDLVFFDGSHELDCNIATYEKLEAALGAETLLLVHNTGLWERSCMQDAHQGWTGEWIDSERLSHRPGQRGFAQWLSANRGWSRVDLGSRKLLRHGISMLQRHPN
jgi:Protein of unknown function (DUF3431)